MSVSGSVLPQLQPGCYRLPLLFECLQQAITNSNGSSHSQDVFIAVVREQSAFPVRGFSSSLYRCIPM